jgi:hypothetical protein
MAKDKTRPVRPAQLAEDRDAFDALQAIENYAPANQAYTVASIQTLHDRIDEAQREATQAEAEAAARRAALKAAQWDFHDAMLGVKDQVTALFGPNSDELAALGMKKKSEYKSPKRRKPGGGNGGQQSK